jgi:hypothetical protein
MFAESGRHDNVGVVEGGWIIIAGKSRSLTAMAGSVGGESGRERGR